MTMQSLSLLPELRKLPAVEGFDSLGTDDTVTRVRGMDRNHFAIEVSQATEEVMEALFRARNVPDDRVNELTEAYGRSFSSFAAEGRSVHEHFQEMIERGDRSVTGFVSNLKGKVAELRTEDVLEERFPSYNFELASSPTQPGWDLIGTSSDGPDILVQVKLGAQTYTGDVLETMHAHPNYTLAVSSEIYDRMEQSHPELVSQLIDIGPATEMTESVKDNLDKLASNSGVDVPDSIGEALPYVGEVVLGIKLILDIVRTERDLADVDLTERSKVHGIRALGLVSRFGINQVCIWAGTAAGGAAGTVMPGPGNVIGGLGGGLAGIGGGMLLNKLLQPRIEEVAMKLVGGDADDIFYLMNKAEIDQLAESFSATRV